MNDEDKQRDLKLRTKEFVLRIIRLYTIFILHPSVFILWRNYVC
jgi:hypothetical protein